MFYGHIFIIIRANLTLSFAIERYLEYLLSGNMVTSGFMFGDLII